ncbi:MAG TPA: J domain-containing protein [Candidatus Limnocylindrales bacterium]
MAPRPPLPADDLYARLEIPVDASFEAIEIAWRALLKRHHPDVAGNDGLDTAKRINVAHDWLSDPDLRARYDRERYPDRSRAPSARAWPAPPEGSGSQPPVVRRPPLDPAQALERFVARAARLSDLEFDRLSVAQPPPIAFVASIERFLSAERLAAVRAVEVRLRDRLPPERWSDLPTRDAILAVAHELVLADFLDEHLAEPFRGRVRDRLTRAWDAAVDQPRYGPNTPAVERFVARTSRLTPGEIATMLRASGRSRVPADPWPRSLDPEDDEALRVSATLAQRDASEAVWTATLDLDRAEANRTRRLIGRAAHAVALRHAFTAAEFAELVGPWVAATGDPATGRRHGERIDPSVRRA